MVSIDVEQDPASAEREIFTPSRLNRLVRDHIESGFPLIWLEGEISNLARPRSGHLYFSLKDERAQVRCAMFRQRNMYLRFRPDEGMHVLARGRLSLYEARGDFQLLVEHLEEAGEGRLQRELERLKQRLDAAGIFALEHKRTLPAFPGRIGVITSATGAAVRDVISVLRRRYPAAAVRIYPVPVQGDEAPPAIVRALNALSAHADCDVAIITRGGGSLEDLWAFNDEAVAWAIHGCSVPIVSAVGHEVDVTIADLVADARAPTPSAAAEQCTPDGVELRRSLSHRLRRLSWLAAQALRERMQRVDRLEHRLTRAHPRRLLAVQRERLLRARQRNRRLMRQALERDAARARGLDRRLRAQSPQRHLPGEHRRWTRLHSRLAHAGEALHRQRSERLQSLSQRLEAVSPLGSLARGYSILRRDDDGGVVRSMHAVSEGERVQALLADGGLVLRVEDRREALTLRRAGLGEDSEPQG